MTPADVGAVLRVIRQAFGADEEAHGDQMTGRVVYPEVRWRHDSTGLRDPRLGAAEAALGLPDPP